MSIAALMEGMAAKGATLDVILMAVRALEAEQGKAAEKRAQAAERKRRERERKRDSHATVTGLSVDNPGHPPFLDKEIPPRPPKEINPIPVGIAHARKGFPIPDGVTADQWLAFCQQRKKKLNDRAYDLLTNKLRTLARDGWPPGEMIDLAIERGWETVFKPTGSQNGNRPANDQQIANPRLRAAVELEAERNGGIGRATW